MASCSNAEDDCLASSDEDGISIRMMHLLQLYHLELQ